MVINQSSMSTGARFLDFLPQYDEPRGKLFRWVVLAGPLLTVSQDKLASATPLKDVWSFQQCGPLPKCWFKLILLCGGLKTNVLKMSQMRNLFSSGLKAPSSICLDYHFLWVVFHLYLRWSLPCSTLRTIFPSKLEWDLTNGPPSKLLELYIRYSGLGVRSVGRVGDFLESWKNSCIFGVTFRTPHYLSPEIVNNEAWLQFCYLCLRWFGRYWHQGARPPW